MRKHRSFADGLANGPMEPKRAEVGKVMHVGDRKRARLSRHPPVDDVNRMACCSRQGLVVGDDDNRAALVGEAAEDRKHRRSVFRIERARRLVGQDVLGVVRERARSPRAGAARPTVRCSCKALPCPTDGLLWKWAGLTSFTSGTGYRAGLER